MNGNRQPASAGEDMQTSDSTLQDEVMAELRWDSSTNAANIGVSAHDGAVTLTGHVASYPQRIAADKAARRIRGVVAVANELDVHLPASWQRDDTDIAEGLARALSESPLVDPGSVKATVTRAWVKLEGEVNWAYQRTTAERIARHVVGVLGITNAITLKARPTAHDVDREIRAALHRRADLDAHSIHVEVLGNVVTLTGNVSSLAEERAATSAAAAAPGVARVASRLRVIPAPRLAGSRAERVLPEDIQPAMPRSGLSP
ncbi:MAG: BON domain-containing protein [Candidatus Dormiibacterota bacterium]